MADNPQNPQDILHRFLSEMRQLNERMERLEHRMDRDRGGGARPEPPRQSRREDSESNVADQSGLISRLGDSPMIRSLDEAGGAFMRLGQSGLIHAGSDDDERNRSRGEEQVNVAEELIAGIQNITDRVDTLQKQVMNVQERQEQLPQLILEEIASAGMQ